MKLKHQVHVLMLVFLTDVVVVYVTVVAPCQVCRVFLLLK